MAAVLLLVLILGGSLAGPGVTWAAPAADQVLMQKVIQNISRENYEEALGDLKKAWEQGPKTAEKAYLFGVVYRHMMRHKEARGYLEEAVIMKPSFPEAQIMLADTLIALNQPEQALPHLQQLPDSGYEPGQTAFLRGWRRVKRSNSLMRWSISARRREIPNWPKRPSFRNPWPWRPRIVWPKHARPWNQPLT